MVHLQGREKAHKSDTSRPVSGRITSEWSPHQKEAGKGTTESEGWLSKEVLCQILFLLCLFLYSLPALTRFLPLCLLKSEPFLKSLSWSVGPSVHHETRSFLSLSSRSAPIVSLIYSCSPCLFHSFSLNLSWNRICPLFLLSQWYFLSPALKEKVSAFVDISALPLLRIQRTCCWVKLTLHDKL